MLYKDYFGSIVCSIVMLILGGAMSIVGILATGAPITYVGLIQSWGTAFLFNYLAALLFPVGKWAHACCVFCKANPNSLKYQLISVFVQTFVFVTCVTAGMMTVNVGFNEMYWPAFFQMYPILFTSGYVVAFFVGMFASKIASDIVSK